MTINQLLDIILELLCGSGFEMLLDIGSGWQAGFQAQVHIPNCVGIRRTRPQSIFHDFTNQQPPGCHGNGHGNFAGGGGNFAGGDGARKFRAGRRDPCGAKGDGAHAAGRSSPGATDWSWFLKGREFGAGLHRAAQMISQHRKSPPEAPPPVRVQSCPTRKNEFAGRQRRSNSLCRTTQRPSWKRTTARTIFAEPDPEN